MWWKPFLQHWGVDLSSGSQDSRTVMGSNQLMIRGMNSSQTLVLVDGHRLADEDTASSQNMNLLQRFDLSQVEQIDIIRGADGASYGSSAMGGGSISGRRNRAAVKAAPDSVWERGKIPSIFMKTQKGRDLSTWR